MGWGLGRVMRLASAPGAVILIALLTNPSGLLWLEGLVQGGGSMSAGYRAPPDLLYFRVGGIRQPAHLMGKVSMVRRPVCHVPPARQWLANHEQVPGPVALVLIIKPLLPSRLGRDGSPLLLGGLVETERAAWGHRVRRRGPARPPCRLRTRRSPWECTTPSSATA